MFCMILLLYFTQCHFLALIVDETTDESNREQVVICLQWVDSSLEAHEEFIGIYHVANRILYFVYLAFVMS